MRLGWWLAVLLGLALGAQALEPAKRLTEYRMEQWNSSRGFPAQAATDILQSRSGHLWITTFNGLVRFDGISFRVFQPSNTPTMSTGNLWSIVEDRDGILWAGSTGKELFRCSGGEIAQVPLKGPIGNVLKLAFDAQGSLWIGSNHGLFRLDQGNLVPVDHPDLVKVDITALRTDRSGNLWIATRRNGLWMKGPEGVKGPYLPRPPAKTPEILTLAQGSDGAVFVGTLGQGVLTLQGQFLVPPPWFRSLDEASVGALLCGARGELWIGGNQGLHRVVDGQVDHLGEREGFPVDRIQSLAQDREGNLWVGPWRDGLIRLSNGKFRVFTKQGGLPHNTILAVDEDAQGRLWVGTHAGVGRIDAQGPVAVEAINRQLPKARDIKDLHWDSRGTLWLTTLEGLFAVHGEEVRPVLKGPGDPISGVRVILESRSGGLWLGTSAGLFRHLDGRVEPLSSREALGQEIFVLSLYEDSAKRLWIGTRAHGLVVLEQGKFRSFTTRDGLPTDSIFRVNPDEDGSLWIGTANGLARYRGGRFQSLNQKNGLISGAIYQVLPAGKEHLWLLGERGFCRLSRAEVEAVLDGRIPQVEGRTFDEGDGLRVAACTSVGKGLRSRDGRIAIPTPGGLVVAEPGPLPFNTVIPSVSVDLLVRDQQEFLFPAGRQLIPPGSKEIELHFSAPSLVAPEKVRYRYRLEDSDPQWRDAGNRHFAVYSHLDPGTYRFRVIACNNDGVWNKDGATLELEAQRRFTQTWGFRLILAGFAGALGWALLRFRLHQLRQQAHALEVLVEARTKELAEANEALRNQSLTDPLTGLRNRRYLGVCMPEDLAQVNRAQHRAAALAGDRFAMNIDLLFIMVDMDHFKEVNDTYGHHAGDLVLQQLSDILRVATRDTDTLIRWGGEEFLVVGRNVARHEAGQLAERIRAGIEDHSFDLGGGVTIKKTCSLGFTFFPFLPKGLVPEPPRAALGAPGGVPPGRRDERSGSTRFEPDAGERRPPPQPEGTLPGGRSAASGPLNDEPHRPAGPSLQSIPPDDVAAHGGSGTSPEGPDFLTWEAVVDLADHCLYVAKHSGRNAWVGLSPTLEATWEGLGGASARKLDALIHAGTVKVLTSLPTGTQLDWEVRV